MSNACFEVLTLVLLVNLCSLLEKSMRLIAYFAFLAATSVPVVHAVAADIAPSDGCHGSCLEYSGTFELNAAWLHPSDTNVGDSSLIVPTVDSNFRLRTTEELSFIAKIKSEPVFDAEPGTNQIFKGAGSYLDVLKAQYDFESFSLWGGKIHPTFGRAWDVTPGLHGTDLAESYDLLDRLGAGASYGFDAAGIANKLQLSAFTVDRTIFSGPLLNDSGRASLIDGGAGNTTGISSVAAALDGCMGGEVDSCYDDGSFGYQLAARYQKGGAGSDGNELGFLGSLNKTVSLTDDTTLKLFGEGAWFRNFQGTADNALVVTGSAAIEMDAATYSRAYSQQKTFVAGESDTFEHLIDATAMYALGENLSIS